MTAGRRAFPRGTPELVALLRRPVQDGVAPALHGPGAAVPGPLAEPAGRPAQREEDAAVLPGVSAHRSPAGVLGHRPTQDQDGRFPTKVIVPLCSRTLGLQAGDVLTVWCPQVQDAEQVQPEVGSPCYGHQRRLQPQCRRFQRDIRLMHEATRHRVKSADFTVSINKLSLFYPLVEEGLYVSGAFHEVRIEVTEDGTKAAAATGDKRRTTPMQSRTYLEDVSVKGFFNCSHGATQTISGSGFQGGPAVFIPATTD